MLLPCVAMASLEPRRTCMRPSLSPPPNQSQAHVQVTWNSCTPSPIHLASMLSPHEPGNILESKANPHDHVFWLLVFMLLFP